jgi:hypothetical protein
MPRRWPKWALPVFCVFLGTLCLVAFWVGGDRGSGIYSFAVMTVFGLVILAGGRFELIRGLRGDGRDEYWARLDKDATLFAGMVTLIVLLGLVFWEWAHGRTGSPYSEIAALAGLAYIVGVVWIRLRS